MNFEAYLLREIKHHPSVMPRDMIKFCFQAAFGAEHLIADEKRARAYFDAEFEAVEPRKMPLFEELSPRICRVNLAAWKAKKLPSEWLFRIFLLSATDKKEQNTDFFALLNTVGKLAKQGSTPFSHEAWEGEKAVYLQKEPAPVHHSESYRQAEKPAYRLADTRFMRLIPILEAVAARNYRKDRAFVIAIDGRAASGKSTMAEQLNHILDASLIHTDDFFLPPELRTKERFSIAGGNIHHERLAKEVIPYVGEQEAFSYGVFDCSQMQITEKRQVADTAVRVVEGSYATHPALGRYADLTVFSHVDPAEQLARIRKRNGEQMAEIFRTRWIPFEEDYFCRFEIMERADLRL